MLTYDLLCSITHIYAQKFNFCGIHDFLRKTAALERKLLTLIIFWHWIELFSVAL